jgi:hypothetical protein
MNDSASIRQENPECTLPGILIPMANILKRRFSNRVKQERFFSNSIYCRQLFFHYQQGIHENKR